MCFQYDEEHFTSVLFPFYPMESCHEPHLKSILLLHLCKCILYLYTKIKMLIFLRSIYIVYGIESAAYGVIFTSCLCQNPNERGTSE